jgi:hypothetical protein
MKRAVIDTGRLFWIRVSENAIESLVLAAVEAYALGDGRKKEVETAGLLWGMQRKASESTDGRRFIYVEKIAQSLSALRRSGSVAFHEHAPRLMNSMVSRLAPQMSLLGHFHTHPYANLDEVRSARGYEISDADRQYLTAENEDSDFYWEESIDTPLMLVMTICKLGRVHEKKGGKHISWNTFEFDLGDFRFWLTGVVGYLDELEVRCNTLPMSVGDDRPEVFLDMDSKFYNYKGSKILRDLL